MSAAPEIILSIKNLHKSYGTFKAVDDLSFDVYKGDVFGFLGPNGAGKSTTIRMILSLIRPNQGEIDIFGRSLRKERNFILRNIGCIVEKPDFYKYLSAEENIFLFSKLSGVNATKKKIGEVLEFVGLEGRGKDKVKGFSHGMKQRLGIAQTLIHDPELIILDEPTTGLDPRGIIDIRNLILQLRKEKGKTVILSSHILSEIELIATRMVIINKGKAMVQGSVADLLNVDELLVVIRVNDTVQATGSLNKAGYKTELMNNDVVVHADNAAIPAINKLLCDAGVEVFAIEPKRKLEDYFLKLIEGN